MQLSVDGIWGTWAAYTRCSKTCDTGFKTRTRSCEFDKVAPHGSPCTGVQNDTTTCLKTVCPGKYNPVVLESQSPK